MLCRITLTNFYSQNGTFFPEITLSYRHFGQELDTTDEIILVNHALTGDSRLVGENGWWNEVVGPNKAIDTNRFAVFCFNLPGNEEDQYHESYQHLQLHDIADLIVLALEELEITHLSAILGGSIGGMLTWQLAVHHPDIADLFIPIASDHSSNDWMIAWNSVQRQLLKLDHPSALALSRQIAMISFRTAESFEKKFLRQYHDEKQCYQVESYLEHQGKKLEKRFNAKSLDLLLKYMMDAKIEAGNESTLQALNRISRPIRSIRIASDILFCESFQLRTNVTLDYLNKDHQDWVIQSIHGHDAFLVDHEKIGQVIQNLVQTHLTKESINENIKVRRYVAGK